MNIWKDYILHLTNIITDWIDLILTNKSFQFDDKNYIQTVGTAMGTKTSPMYAPITLEYFEKSLYKIIGGKYSNIKTEFIRSLDT